MLQLQWWYREQLDQEMIAFYGKLLKLWGAIPSRKERFLAALAGQPPDKAQEEADVRFREAQGQWSLLMDEWRALAWLERFGPFLGAGELADL